MPTTAFDEKHFTAELTKHKPAIGSFCHAQLGNRQDAQEVLQTTCVTLWQKASEWDPSRPFLPWAFGIARFTIMAHIRDRGRERLVFDVDVETLMARESEAYATRHEDRREALRQCFEKIGDENRELLRMHYVLGHSIKELSRRLERGESALKMNLLRLREQLSLCVSRRLQPPL
jgi:RNA polymerase sigma-70 factor (ECF subfamily)